MEYSNNGAVNNQSGYTQPQGSPHASPGCTLQSPTTAFSASDGGPHPRTYVSGQQPYPSHEYDVHSGAHNAVNIHSYPQTYPSENHGQSLTLNQLLQGNTSNNYQPRPPHVGPVLNRNYDNYGLSYKPGMPSGFTERNQAGMYPFGGPRYGDPFSRPAYPSYPPGSGYQYYQGSPMHPQPHSRQPMITQHPVNCEYPPMGPTGIPMRSPQSSTLSGGAQVNDRSTNPSSIHGPPPSSSPLVTSQLSSTVHGPGTSFGSGSGSSANWSGSVPPSIGSPQSLGGYSQQQPPVQPSKMLPVPRDSPFRSIGDSTCVSINAPMATEIQTETAANTDSDDPCARPQSRLSETGQPLTVNNSGSVLREQSDDTSLLSTGSVESTQQQQSKASSLRDATPPSKPPSGSSGMPLVNESSPIPVGSSSGSASVSPGPVGLSRSTPPSQPYPAYSQQAPTLNAIPHMTSVGSLPKPMTHPVPVQSNRPYGPTQRQPYPYFHPQANQFQASGPYAMGGRPPGFYVSGGPGPGAQLMRSVSPAPAGHPTTGGGNSMGLPSSASRSMPCASQFPPGHSPQQMSGTSGSGMMPPPAAPPPVPPLSTAQQGPSVSGQSTASPYALTTSGSGPAGGSQMDASAWDNQPVQQSPNTPCSSSQQYVRGMAFSGSPQPTGISPAGGSGQIPASGGVYPTSQPPHSAQYSGQQQSQVTYPATPAQLQQQQTVYLSHGQPHLPHAYPGAVGPGMNPTMQSHHHQQGTGVPSPHPYAPGLVQPGTTGRDHFHSQFAPGVGQPPMQHDRRLTSPYGPTLSGTGETDMGSPSMRSPVSGKPMPGNLGNRNVKVESGMRSLTPTGSGGGNVPSANVSHGNTISSPGSGIDSVQRTASVVDQQFAYSNQTSSLSSYPNPNAYWSDGALPNAAHFSAGIPSGMSGGPPTGLHSFSVFPQQNYRSPPQQLPQQQHLQGLPNSMGYGVSQNTPGANYASGTTHGHHTSAHQASPNSSFFHKLVEMGNEPERRAWLEHYVRFMEEIGKPLVGLPQVVKQPLDLYRFYLAVRERGGVLEVIRSRRWKEISQFVNINASASAAYTLRKNYCKYLLDYECRFDRGGTDPRPLLAHIESSSGKKKKLSGVDGDTGPGSLMNQSGSGHSLAPPSPTGSHSSASSSLLPPSSVGTSSTTGAASGSTMGTPAGENHLGTQSRFSESNNTVSDNAILSENQLRMANSPSIGASFNAQQSSVSVQSPQRPLSNLTVNGYSNVPSSSNESLNRSGAHWPWSADLHGSPSNVGHSATAIQINGYQTAPSNRGLHGGQGEFDSIGRSHLGNAALSGSPKLPQQRFTIPNSISPTSVSLNQPNTDPAAPSIPSSTSTTALIRPPEPTVHHHPTSGHVSAHSSAMGIQHSQLPATGHLGLSHPLPGVSPYSTVHQRFPGMSHGIRSQPFPSAPNLGSNSADPVTLLRMHHHIRPSTTQMSGCLPGILPPFYGTSNSSATGFPAHLVHHHGQRSGYVATILKRVEHSPFPPGSIEATVLEQTRRRRYRAKDLGTIAPFKLLMALRSGLNAEVSWALNCLNIMLRDEASIDSIVNGSTLPVLITSLSELWRHTLGELFDHDLFITTLELPADLTMLSNQTHLQHPINFSTESHIFSTIDKRSASTSRLADDVSKELVNSCNPPNVLAKLERGIISVALARGISISDLRSGIRRLFHKCNDKEDKKSLRVRNGLLVKRDPGNSATIKLGSYLMNGSSESASLLQSSTITPGSRSRKRNRQHLGQHGNNIGNTGSSNLSSIVASLNTPTGVTNVPRSSVINPMNLALPWHTIRIITATNSLRAPEALSNLCEIAQFVMDDLMPVTRPCSLSLSKTHTAGSEESNRLKRRDAPIANNASDFTNNLVTKRLCHLVLCGGGDTTCHIMPPFGAALFPSKHWNSGFGDRSSCYISSLEVTAEHQRDGDRDQTSTPPPEVIKERCSPRHDDNTDDLIADDDCGQPSTKRTRHTSASPLSCPILSPQQLDEISDVSEMKDVTSCLDQFSDSDNLKTSHKKEEEDDSLHFFIDTSGSCPLRAREELVPHGGISVWSNNNSVDSNEARAVRCLCVSTVLRNLSFLNVVVEHPLSSHLGVLSLVGRVIMLGHNHVGPHDTWETVDLTAKALEPSLCAWWTPTWLEDMRENAMVLLVNLAGHLNLINMAESVVRPILEGLIHWIICPTAASIDPFPGHRTLSPRRLALEALNRLCVHSSNVDLILATPDPHQSDLRQLFDRLVNWLALPEDQVTRELALSTIHYLTGGGLSFSSPSDSTAGKLPIVDSTSSVSVYNHLGTTLLAGAKPCPISGLLSFIEAAEATTRRVIDQCGVQALQERPELMGTSLEMVRRAGALLSRLATDPAGRMHFTPNLELRLMDLVTSHVLDATVAHLLCGVLHRLSPTKKASDDKPIIFPCVPPIPTPTVVAQLLSTHAASKKTNEEKPLEYGATTLSNNSSEMKTPCPTSLDDSKDSPEGTVPISKIEDNELTNRDHDLSESLPTESDKIILQGSKSPISNEVKVDSDSSGLLPIEEHVSNTCIELSIGQNGC